MIPNTVDDFQNSSTENLRNCSASKQQLLNQETSVYLPATDPATDVSSRHTSPSRAKLQTNTTPGIQHLSRLRGVSLATPQLSTSSTSTPMRHKPHTLHCLGVSSLKPRVYPGSSRYLEPPDTLAPIIAPSSYKETEDPASADARHRPIATG